MSLRWACRLAMVVSDFGVLLHEDGAVLKVEPNVEVGTRPFDAALDGDGRVSDTLARAAWIKLSTLEEYSVAACEANALLEGNARCNTSEATLLAWRQIAANEWTGTHADAYVSHTSCPLLRQFMSIASCTSEGRHFELTCHANYEDAWLEFERFCAEPYARPSTEWGRKYRRPVRVEKKVTEERFAEFPVNGISPEHLRQQVLQQRI